MGEYETNALRGELSATQTSLYNLQGAVELLKHALDQLPSDIAAAITQGIADAMPAMYPPTISPAEAAELMADAAPGAPAPAPAPAFADEEIAERIAAWLDAKAKTLDEKCRKAQLANKPDLADEYGWGASYVGDIAADIRRGEWRKEPK